MIIGTLPVVIALVSNKRDAVRDGALRWRVLLPSLLLIGAGIGCVNQAEWQALRQAGDATHFGSYAAGAVLALLAVACWTWYPIRNADWLRAHPDRPPSTWATAQGLATLPLATLALAAFCGWQAAGGDPSFALPLGPTPLRFVALMLAMGLLASWLGTLLWNQASQRLPTTLAGQLIVFETLAALVYAFALRGRAPAGVTLLGVALLVAGVLWALRARPQHAAAPHA